MSGYTGQLVWLLKYSLVQASAKNAFIREIPRLSLLTSRDSENTDGEPMAGLRNPGILIPGWSGVNDGARTHDPQNHNLML